MAGLAVYLFSMRKRPLVFGSEFAARQMKSQNSLIPRISRGGNYCACGSNFFHNLTSPNSRTLLTQSSTSVATRCRSSRVPQGDVGGLYRGWVHIALCPARERGARIWNLLRALDSPLPFLVSFSHSNLRMNFLHSLFPSAVVAISSLIVGGFWAIISWALSIGCRFFITVDGDAAFASVVFLLVIRFSQALYV